MESVGLMKYCLRKRERERGERGMERGREGEREKEREEKEGRQETGNTRGGIPRRYFKKDEELRRETERNGMALHLRQRWLFELVLGRRPFFRFLFRSRGGLS